MFDIKKDIQAMTRSEEHTSELQSRLHLVCRLLLEKKKHLRVEIGCAFTFGRIHQTTVVVRGEHAYPRRVLPPFKRRRVLRIAERDTRRRPADVPDDVRTHKRILMSSI